MTVVTNRYLADPEGYTGEDGDFAYVRVTLKTPTADAARDWLINDPDGHEAIGYEPAEHTIHPEHIELRGVHFENSNPVGLLPDSLDVERQVKEGLLIAWWRFDVSLATTERPEAAERVHRMLDRLEAENRHRAREWRGPWWWRLRCWVAERALRLGGRLEPDDRSTVSWYEDGCTVITQVRRPTDA